MASRTVSRLTQEMMKVIKADSTSTCGTQWLLQWITERFGKRG